VSAKFSDILNFLRGYGLCSHGNDSLPSPLELDVGLGRPTTRWNLIAAALKLESGWRNYHIAQFHVLSLQHEKHRLPIILGPA
jgi:hypothetical protein